MKLLALLFVLMLAAPASAQRDDPLAPIKAALTDPTKPFSLIVEFKLKPGSVAAAKAVVEGCVKNTHEEPGNLAYACHRDARTPDTLVFVETWASLASLESHVARPYTQDLLGKLSELAAEPMKARVLMPFVPAAAASAPAAKRTIPAAEAPAPKRKVLLPAPQPDK